MVGVNPLKVLTIGTSSVSRELLMTKQIPVMRVRGNTVGSALVVSIPEGYRDAAASIPRAEWSVSGERLYVPLSQGWRLNELFGESCILECLDDVAFESVTAEPPEVLSVPDYYDFEMTPFQHQLRDFYAFAEQGRKMWNFSYEQGTGKTYAALTISDYLMQRDGFQNTLVVVARNILKYHWRGNVEDYIGKKAWMLGTRYKKNGERKSDATLPKIEDINNNALLMEYPYLVVNVESLRDRDLVKAIKKRIEQGVINCVIVDEAHFLRNPTAKMTKGLLALKPEYRMTLTGTPLVNSPLDVFTTMKWLEQEPNTWTAFKNHYCIYHEFQRGRIVGYHEEALKDLKKRFGAITTRVLMSDVLDIPEPLYHTDYLEMSEAQRAIYNEVLTQTIDAIDQLPGNFIHPATVTMRLRQATTCPSLLTSHKVPNCKLEGLRVRLQEAMDAGISVLVFSHLKEPINYYAEQLKDDFNIGMITGDVKLDKRNDNVEAFKRRELPILMGTISAMGTGLDIGTAEMVIFIDEPWTMVDMKQAVSRANRSGNDKWINVYSLYCVDSVDDLIRAIIKQKGAMAGYLVDNKPIPKELLIDILRGGR